MTFYLTSIDNISVSRTVFEKFDFKILMVCSWPLTPKGHLESKFFIAFESPYMTFYLTTMDNISQFRTVFEIFDFKVFRVRIWPLTPESPPRSNFLYYSKAHLRLPIWLLWTPSLYLVPLSRYSTSKFLGFDLDFWPLKVIGGQNFLYHLEAHIWLPIWLLWTPSLYFVPFSRYSTSKFLGFDLDLWALKVIWGQKKFTIRKPIYDFLFDFYEHHLSISYRSRDIRLQSFQGLTLTFDPWRSPGVKNFIPIESPYMTSYLTFMNTISLSRTVLEIFDFKVFRVWPWPLTPKGHLEWKKNYSIRKPIYDFLFDFYEHHLSISYRSRDIRLQSFQGLTLTFDP